MKIAIRMDDITPDMDWAKFLRFKELCDLYQVKPLIGVVPDNRDETLMIDEKRPDFWEYIRKLDCEGWTIAQHGVYHVYTTKKMGCFPLNRLSELAGLSYEKQYRLLSHGRNKLEKHGIYTDIFMAPAHSYDRTTLRVLENIGIEKITDGFGKKPYKSKELTFYPIAFRQSSALKKRKKGYTTFVVHTNTMSEKEFRKYEKMFRKHSDKFISYSELLDVRAKKRGIFGHMKEYIMAKTKHMLVGIKSIF